MNGLLADPLRLSLAPCDRGRERRDGQTGSQFWGDPMERTRIAALPRHARVGKPCVPATLGPPNSKRPGCLDLSQTKAKLCFWRRREIAFWRWRRSLPTRLWMIRPLADFVSFMFGKPPADEASPIEWSGTAWRSPGGAGGRFAFIPIMPSRLDYTSATASTAPGPIRARRIQWLSLRRHRDTIIHNSW